MTYFDRYLSQIAVGSPQTFENLTIYPILASQPEPFEYVTLDDALSAGHAEISELSEGGSVPELRFLNKGDKPVLLVDGEELIGAKQNRVLNLSILAPEGQEIVIPVSCVESGRWNYKSRHFRASNRMHFARSRAKRASQISGSLMDSGSRRSDQDQIWDDISEKEIRLRMASETSAMSDMYDQLSGRLDKFVATFKPLPNQVGAVFALGSELVGVDLFNTPKVFGKLIQKFLRSYALDAIEENQNPGDAPTSDDVSEWLNKLKAVKSQKFKAVGLGDDIRITGDGYAGGALVVGKEPVHIYAFATQ